MPTATTDWDHPSIADARALTEEDAPLVNDLVAVLEKHNALDRFGIALLHQHFPIATDEVLCEDVDVRNRVLSTRPIKKETVAREPHTVTLWSLRDKTARMACVCHDYGQGHAHFSSPTKS